MQPAGFDEERALEWSHWVLDHGLPALPGAQIAVGESVPVAYWIGPTTAAVLHIRRIQNKDEPEPYNDVDVTLFCRVEDTWEDVGGGGAGGWSGDPLVRWQVPARSAILDGKQYSTLGDTGVTALWGEVGTAAAFAEVEQAGHVTRRPVEAPTGHYVVSGDWHLPFTVRVFDASGDRLTQIEEPAGSHDEPPGWCADPARSRPGNVPSAHTARRRAVSCGRGAGRCRRGCRARSPRPRPSRTRP